jgi:hypothetical protein
MALSLPELTLLRPGEKPGKPPTVEVVPPADDWSAGLEALEIAFLAGLDLDDWQQYILLHALGRQDGLWTAFEVALIIARQNGKSEILIAVILWALFTELDDPRLVIFAAHEYKTAREIFLRLKFLLQPPAGSDPLLHAHSSLVDDVKTVRTANGEESVELYNGRRVRFLARTSGSGRGFTGDIVLLDEAYKLNQEQMAALLPTMGARPNPQIWYASMGPFEDSEVQTQVMERARSDEPGALAYFGYEADGDVSVADRDEWVRCNPAHPHRMSMATLVNEFQALGEEGFAREKLCLRVSSVERAIPADVWMAAQSADAEPADPVTLAVDVDETRSWYSVVAVGGGVAELVEHKPVSGLVARLSQLAADHAAVLCLDASGPAGSLVDDLEAEGVPVEKFSSRDVADACGRLYDALVDKTLTVRRSPDFDKAVSSAARKPMGDAWSWSRSRSNGDVSPIVALTLAHAAERPVEVSVMVV